MPVLSANIPRTLSLGGLSDLFALSLEPNDDGKVVLEIPVLPLGTFIHKRYGTLEWTAEKFAEMIANFKNMVTGYQPMLNQDHAPQNPLAATAPAFGWVTDLFTKSDGLYALVELTRLGVEAITDRTYRYISAEVCGVYTRSTGEEFNNVIVGAALTNTPFHDTMPGLFSRDIPEFGVQSFATLEGDLSFYEIEDALRLALRAEVSHVPYVYRYICDTFPNFVIYEEYDYSKAEYTECCHRRGYSITAGVVTLADDVEEVEEVWASKARQSMNAARFAAIRERQTKSFAAPSEAVPTAGSNGIMKWLTGLGGLLGLSQNATKDQVVVALAKAPDNALDVNIELSNPVAENNSATTEGDAVTLSGLQGQVASLSAMLTTVSNQLNTVIAERDEANANLARERATGEVERFISLGKIAPKDKEEALEFALENPERFRKVYESAAPVVDTGRYGRGGIPNSGELPGAGAENPTIEFTKAVQARMKFSGLDFVSASQDVARENPALYERHIASTRKGGR